MRPPLRGVPARSARAPLTAHMTFAALGALALAAPRPAVAGPDVRVEAVAGYDTNATRAEGTAGGSAVNRLVIDLSDGARPAAGWWLSGRYHGGVRSFMSRAAIPCRGGEIDPSGENALFQRFDGGLSGRPLDWLTVGARIDVRDRLTADPCHPRDFTHLRGTAPVGWVHDDLSLQLAAVGERFHYKPDDRFDATSVGARLTAGWSPRRWNLSAFGERLDRTYRDVGEARAPADRILRIGGGVRWSGPALLAAHYAYSVNDSTREGGGYGRHALTLSGTAPLPGAFLLSGRVSLVRILHDEALLLPDAQTLQDEGRSAVLLRLERPLYGRLSAVVHGGWWGSPFDTGPSYDRWLALGGVSFGGAE